MARPRSKIVGDPIPDSDEGWSPGQTCGVRWGAREVGIAETTARDAVTAGMLPTRTQADGKRVVRLADLQTLAKRAEDSAKE